jgi:hypothetical protein
MATLTVTRSYEDGEVLVRADLDAFLDDIETFINVTKIDDDNIQTSGITGSTKLAASSVTSAKIRNGAITSAKIADDAVTRDKIAANVAGDGLSQNVNGALEVNVDDATIEISSDTVRLKDNGITTAKIQDEAVTKEKLEALGQQESSSSGSYSNATASETEVVSVSLTTVGRPVMLFLVSADTGDTPTACIKLTASGGAFVGCAGYIYAYRDSTKIAGTELLGSVTATAPIHAAPPGLMCIDTPAAGTYTYAIKARLTGAPTSSQTIHLINLKLVAVEL